MGKQRAEPGARAAERAKNAARMGKQRAEPGVRAAEDTAQLSTLAPERSVVICEGQRERVRGCATVLDVLHALAGRGIDGDYLTAGRLGDRLDEARLLSDVADELWLRVRGRGGERNGPTKENTVRFSAAAASPSCLSVAEHVLVSRVACSIAHAAAVRIAVPAGGGEGPSCVGSVARPAPRGAATRDEPTHLDSCAERG